MLRADRNAVGDGAAEQLCHRVMRIRGFEIQPVGFGITHQQSLALEAAPDALADALNQYFEFGTVGHFDAAEKGRGIFAQTVNPVDRQ